MNRLALALIFLLAALGAPIGANDAVPPASEGTAGNPPAPGDHAAADAAAEQGRKSLQLYRKDQAANPNAVIDAAVAFTEAHHQYQALGDTDAVSEMQASIYWCKKQMNLETLKAYLARKGKTETLASMDAIAEKKVEANEAQSYMDRARKFATEHPDDLSTISLRYFEVAERFLGTPISIEAQKLSMEAQSKYMQWLQSGGMARETRFTKTIAAKSGTLVAMPDEKAQKAALTDLKKVYAKDYSRKNDSQKRRFAAKLVSEGEKSRADATIYYVMLNEAVRLAMESEDYERLLDTIEQMASAYTGYERAEQQKFWLKKMNGKAAASAIVTLLDSPQDPTANTTAGKFFCFQLKRWEQGLPMLSLSNDTDLKTVAEQELANPTDDNQRIQVGDSWFALSKKGGPSNEKLAMMARAQHWYISAKGINGLVKERISQRLAEIDKTLPLDLDNLDYDRLTPTQWDKLKGPVKVVQARVDRSGPMMTLKPGERIRVVPHPADSWICQSWNTVVTTTWSGTDFDRRSDSPTTRLLFTLPYERYRLGELLAQVDKGDAQRCGVLTGPGPLWMLPNRPDGQNSGEIRIKLIPVNDE